MLDFQRLESRDLLAGCPCQLPTGDWLPRIAEDSGPDDLVVEFGQTIELTGTHDLHEIRVASGGELIVRDAQLSVETILVEAGGTLRVGPVAEIVFEDGAFDLTRDPDEMAFGLIVLGTVDVQGESKTTFVRLAVAPAAGSSQLVLAEPVFGWHVGDTLVLSDSRALRVNDSPSTLSESQYEIVTVATVSADGTTVGLEAPLRFDHPGSSDGQFLPYVANLTRTVRFRSENPGGMRGHVLLAGHAAAIDVAFAEFEELGRTTIEHTDSNAVDANGTVIRDGVNQLGRYSLHMHHTHAPRIVGNSIHGGLRWGVVVHETNDGFYRDNVIWDVEGAGFAVESGNEHGNVIEHNWSGGNFGDLGPVYRHRGRQGVAFWFSGHQSIVRDNVATNSHIGYGFTAGLNHDVAEIAAAPLLEFSGNEFYGVSSRLAAGTLEIWRLGRMDERTEANAEPSVVDRYTAWNFGGYGIHSRLIDNVTYESPRLVSTAGQTGITFRQRLASDVTVANPDIRGPAVGIEVPNIVAEYGSNRTGSMEISGGTVHAAIGVSVPLSFASEADAGDIPGRRILILNTELVGPVKIDMEFPKLQRPLRNRSLFVNQEVLYQFGPNILEIYYHEQAAEFVPRGPTPDDVNAILSPEAGLNNLQLWQKYGVAVGGRYVANGVVVEGIHGLVEPLGAGQQVLSERPLPSMIGAALGNRHSALHIRRTRFASHMDG